MVKQRIASWWLNQTVVRGGLYALMLSPVVLLLTPFWFVGVIVVLSTMSLAGLITDWADEVARKHGGKYRDN